MRTDGADHHTCLPGYAKGRPVQQPDNNRRLHEPIGDIPPVEFEQMYYQQQPSLAAAA